MYICIRTWIHTNRTRKRSSVPRCIEQPDTNRYVVETFRRSTGSSRRSLPADNEAVALPAERLWISRFPCVTHPRTHAADPLPSIFRSSLENRLSPPLPPSPPRPSPPPLNLLLRFNQICMKISFKLIRITCSIVKKARVKGNLGGQTKKIGLEYIYI